MNIGMVTPYADPERGASVVRVNSFKEYFAEQGHTVTIFAPDRDCSQKKGIVRYKNLRQLVSLLLKADLDVVIGTSPPITHNLHCLLACTFKRIPFILDAKDPFTHILAHFGNTSKTKLFLYKGIEYLTHKKAAHIFVLTPRDKPDISSTYHLPLSKISVIRNGSDPTSVFFDTKARTRIRKALKIPSLATVVLYAGVIGGKSLETLLETCKNSFRKKNVYLLFLFTHDGSLHADMNHQKITTTLKTLRLNNRARIVLNTPYQNLYHYLSAADIALNPIPDFWTTNIPTKVFDYLSAELPMVTKAPKTGSMHDFFVAYGGGYFSTTWEGFSKDLEKALQDPSRRAKGREGRRAIKNHFSRNLFAQEALVILRHLVTS